jgi:hypothetical protein
VRRLTQPRYPSAPGSVRDESGIGAEVAAVLGGLDQPDGAASPASVAGATARALPRMGLAVAASARRARAGGVSGGRWLADTATEIATHLPVRDAAVLHARFPGRPPHVIADDLVAAAGRATAGVGAVAGALAAVEFAAPPALLCAPGQIVAESLLVLAIETRLIAELHELFGRVPDGGRAVRGRLYLAAWVRRRGIEPFVARQPVRVARLATGRQVQGRLVRRVARGGVTLAPLLAGAAAGAALNRRETRRLGERVVADLRPPAAPR